MHEVAIVESLFEQVRDSLRRRGETQPVEWLELQVGEHSGVCKDSLRFAFEWLGRDTEFEDARLELRDDPVRARCAACGGEQPPLRHELRCPLCGSAEIRLEGGTGLSLTGLGVREASC